MEYKFSVPLSLNISTEQMKEITIDFLEKVFDLNTKYYTIQNEYLMIKGEPNYHNGDWCWEKVRKATESDKQLFDIITKIKKYND